MSKHNSSGPRVNEQVRSEQVRVIEDGKPLGVMPSRQALSLAQEKGVDLIEIDPKSSPPVCKLMDFGKFKYEQKKKEQSEKVKKVDTKELKLRPRTDDHDVNVKIRQAREFLEDGDKVRFTVMFKGREMVYKNQGEDLLKQIIDSLKDICQIDSPIKMEGVNMFLTISPLKK